MGRTRTSGTGPLNRRITSVPAIQPARTGDETFDPRSFPQPPTPYFDYTKRAWVFPMLDALLWGNPRDRFRSWEDDKDV